MRLISPLLLTHLPQIVLGLRCLFCAGAAEDPTHAKLDLPELEKQRHLAASDNLEEQIQQLDSCFGNTYKDNL